MKSAPRCLIRIHRWRIIVPGKVQPITVPLRRPDTPDANELDVRSKPTHSLGHGHKAYSVTETLMVYVPPNYCSHIAHIQSLHPPLRLDCHLPQFVEYSSLQALAYT